MMRFRFLAGLLVLVSCISVGAQAAVSKTVPVGEPMNLLVADGPIGVWDYEVAGTEDAYGSGILFVRKENGVHVVEVHLGSGVLNGQDVQVQGNTLNFTLNLDGVERVSVVLNVEKDSILGQISYPHGTFTMNGNRKLAPR